VRFVASESGSLSSAFRSLQGSNVSGASSLVRAGSPQVPTPQSSSSRQAVSPLGLCHDNEGMLDGFSKGQPLGTAAANGCIGTCKVI
jgi:hypothetical protein